MFCRSSNIQANQLCAKGNPTKVDIFSYDDSENTRPLPFKAKFTPRSAVIESLIQTEAEDAKHRLSQYDWDTKLTAESVANK